MGSKAGPEDGGGSGSISFDRAAGVYDRTRSVDPAVWRRVIQALLREIEGHGPVLEVGVGTGRAALPVHEAGVAVTGVDISPAMLERLVVNAGGTRPFPLVLADATALPFGGDSFGASYLVHVLHLVRGWRELLAELVRVTRKVVLIDPGLLGQRGMQPSLSRRFAREAGSSLRALLPGWFELDDLDAAMAAHGAVLRALPPLTAARERSIRNYVEEMSGGMHAFTWSLDEATRREAGRRTLDWAESRWGDVNAPRRMRWRIAWRAYDLR